VWGCCTKTKDACGKQAFLACKIRVFTRVFFSLSYMHANDSMSRED